MNKSTSEKSKNVYDSVSIQKILDGTSYQHSHFTDVRGKDGEFRDFDFSYCIFIRAYFHNAVFTNCKFVGSHFVDCNFRNARFKGCDFSYSRFSGTIIPTNEILDNLPDWPNVRRELLQALRQNSTTVGDYKSEKVFVIREIDSAKEHYRRAWKLDEESYKRKYKPKFRWMISGLKLLSLRIDNLLWGHGERLWKAPIAIIIVISIFSAILTTFDSSLNSNSTINDAINSYTVSFTYCMNLFLGLPDTSGIKGVAILDWSISIIKFLAIGVLVAALCRRLSHR